jgi:hypothetical protein
MANGNRLVDSSWNGTRELSGFPDSSRIAFVCMEVVELGFCRSRSPTKSSDDEILSNPDATA